MNGDKSRPPLGFAGALDYAYPMTAKITDAKTIAEQTARMYLEKMCIRDRVLASVIFAVIQYA